MKNRLWLALAGTVVLVVLATTGTTRALWRDEASINPGTVSTGNLELLAGGQPENYVFTALSASNLAPGHEVSAPLTISNGGSTDLVYRLAGVATATSTAADRDLEAGLSLIVTNDTACGDGSTGNVATLHQGPLAAASYTGTQLAPSSSARLCLTVSLADDAPLSASQGTVTATFTFRGDQAQ